MVVCGVNDDGARGEEAMVGAVGGCAQQHHSDDDGGVACGDDGGGYNNELFYDDQYRQYTSRMITALKVTPPSEEEDEVLSPGGRSCHDPHHIPLHQDLDLHSAIIEAVALEPKYQPALSLVVTPRFPGEISQRMRDGSCHVLRCLKVWYELPSEAFFLAVNNMDRFLTRMRAQPKHLSCIAVSSFSVACEEVCTSAPPSRDSISVISQSKCTAGDVFRMEEIIKNKLELGRHHHNTGQPITPLTLLKLLHAGHRQLLSQHFPQLSLPVPPLLTLIHKLEVVVCDSRAANFRASELSLALLRRELMASAVAGDHGAVHEACLQPLMVLCKVGPVVLTAVEDVVCCVLEEYDFPKPKVQGQVYHRQRLVWKLSNRTLRQLRPTSKLKRHPRLPTISETSLDNTCYFPPVWRKLPSVTHCKSRVKNVSNASLLQEPSEQNNALMDSEEEIGEQEHEIGEEMDTYEEEEEQALSSTEEEVVATAAVLEKMEQEHESKEQAKEALIATAEELEAKPAPEQPVSDKSEASYSQVAKKMREKRKNQTVSSRPTISIPTPKCSPIYHHHHHQQTSPLSKITVTPALSPAVKNLSRLLMDQCSRHFQDSGDVAYYGYHHARLVGILGIEGIDGDVAEEDAANAAVPVIVGQMSSHGNSAKRKKPRVKLDLVAHPRYDSSSDSDIASSSSEEEMDSDYEKEFPPLPLPRAPRHHRLSSSFRKKSSASSAPMKKKKKSEPSSPYATTTRRKIKARKLAQK